MSYTIRTMHLIVGLGNPGKKYEKTRHNLGFRVLDLLYERFGMPNWQDKFEGELSRGQLFKDTLMLLKPQTFMNLSGSSVLPTTNFFKVDTQKELWLIHDDLDLPLGMIRIREDGGSGGHNGVQSVVDRLGHKNFTRFRMGIGRPEKEPVESYVVKPFHKAEQKEVKEMIERTCDAVETALRDGIPRAMTLFNR